MQTKIVELSRVHKPKTCGSKTAMAYMEKGSSVIGALICCGCGEDLR
jgi:hypothetical protein